MNGHQSFLVRLDGIAETQGEAARAKAMELWERPQEEWELAWCGEVASVRRGLAIVDRAKRFKVNDVLWPNHRSAPPPPKSPQHLSLRTSQGEVRIVAHPMCPANRFMLTGPAWAQSFHFSGDAPGIARLSHEIEVSGRRNLRVVLHTTVYARMVEMGASLRMYDDATPFRRGDAGAWTDESAEEPPAVETATEQARRYAAHIEAHRALDERTRRDREDREIALAYDELVRRAERPDPVE